MSATNKLDSSSDSEVGRIREVLSSRSRPVETGCLVKIPVTKLFGNTFHHNGSSSLYGIVGNQLTFCEITNSKTFDVKFYTKNISIPYELKVLLHYPIVDSDMTIIRFPEQNASIDDPNIDNFFHRIDGEWQIRQTYPF